MLSFNSRYIIFVALLVVLLGVAYLSVVINRQAHPRAVVHLSGVMKEGARSGPALLPIYKYIEDHNQYYYLSFNLPLKSTQQCSPNYYCLVNHKVQIDGLLYEDTLLLDKRTYNERKDSFAQYGYDKSREETATAHEVIVTDLHVLN